MYRCMVAFPPFYNQVTPTEGLLYNSPPPPTLFFHSDDIKSIMQMYRVMRIEIKQKLHVHCITYNIFKVMS